jgi:hypothetical protein
LPSNQTLSKRTLVEVIPVLKLQDTISEVKDAKMDPTKMPRKLWEHPNPESTAMWKFMQDLNRTYGLNLKVSKVSAIFLVRLMISW